MPPMALLSANGLERHATVTARVIRMRKTLESTATHTATAQNPVAIVHVTQDIQMHLMASVLCSSLLNPNLWTLLSRHLSIMAVLFSASE